ncbi:MAG: hypothetical protein ACTJHU_10220, partial [Mycetocola sp.]
MKNSHWSAVATGAAALLLLSGCSAEPESAATPEPTAEVETTPAEAPTEESTDEAAPAASGDQPEWALPLINSGDKLGTVTAGDITVDVYQVAVEKATKTGNFVNPDDNKPIIDVGDDIVFVNYVRS